MNFKGYTSFAPLSPIFTSCLTFLLTVSVFGRPFISDLVYDNVMKFTINVLQFIIISNKLSGVILFCVANLPQNSKLSNRYAWHRTHLHDHENSSVSKLGDIGM